MAQPMKMHKETCLDCGWVQRPVWNETDGDWDCDHCGAPILSDEELAEVMASIEPAVTSLVGANDNGN